MQASSILKNPATLFSPKGTIRTRWLTQAWSWQTEDGEGGGGEDFEIGQVGRITGTASLSKELLEKVIIDPIPVSTFIFDKGGYTCSTPGSNFRLVHNGV